MLGRYVERLERWLDRRANEPPEWQEASAFGDSLLYLTVEELAELRGTLQGLAESYLERVSRPELRPLGARPIALLQIAFPDEES